MSVVFYEGRSIYFRPIEPADEPQLRRWINDPRVWATLGHRPPMNECREREWIEGLGKSKTDYALGIVVRDADRLIGTIGLHSINPASRSAVMGIVIGEVEAQNRGHGTEAVRLIVRYGFMELNLNRIQLDVLAINERAMHVYRKAGFVVEGRMRQAVFHNGIYVDVLRMGILREEWNADDAANGSRVDEVSHAAIEA
jgi:RimJ/RimL family protein N-acetyltransferase